MVLIKKRQEGRRMTKRSLINPWGEKRRSSAVEEKTNRTQQTEMKNLRFETEFKQIVNGTIVSTPLIKKKLHSDRMFASGHELRLISDVLHLMKGRRLSEVTDASDTFKGKISAYVPYFITVSSQDNLQILAKITENHPKSGWLCHSKEKKLVMNITLNMQHGKHLAQKEG